MVSTVEEDGDEVFTKISDGCFKCPNYFDESGKPQRVKLEKKLTWAGLFWVCPECGGFYGKVED